MILEGFLWFPCVIKGRGREGDILTFECIIIITYCRSHTTNMIVEFEFWLFWNLQLNNVK